MRAITNRENTVFAAVLLFLILSFISKNVVSALTSSPPQSFQRRMINRQRVGIMTTTTSLTLSSPNNNDDKNSKKKKTSGVYVRPSGAIERGSGFYVPGLEGPRVRLVVGCVLLALNGINQALSSSTTGGSSDLPEQVALVYTFYVLFQAVIEFAKEYMDTQPSSSAASSSVDTTMTSGSNKQMTQLWTSTANDEIVSDDDQFRSNVEWAAASYLALTPAATQLLLLTSSGSQNDGSILYRLGPSTTSSSSTVTTTEKEQRGGINAAFDALSKSKSGRIALPSSHPAVIGLFGTKEDNLPRTVVLQQIATTATSKNKNPLCWMMTSDTDLLARFTTQDFKWLRQMGQHIVLPSS